ncbi:MAG: CPBP family intramembrane metalloprotease [Tannerellaceae bacterium]|nr:CPBP family intramembrane metalloprotease [Tannerellaceae bacterium]
MDKNNKEQYELKPLWSKYFNYDWEFGLFLIAIICIPRFILVLGANKNADYRYMGLIMLISAIIPFIFLSKLSFALTHISHFGLVFINNKWTFFAIPAIIWVISMFFASMIFSICRNRSGSLSGAILCHSAFNLGMIYCIFYLIISG